MVSHCTSMCLSVHAHMTPGVSVSVEFHIMRLISVYSVIVGLKKLVLWG